jgi:DNA polymerase-3 subunit chi
MTRIDFYILPSEEIQARQVFACRLIEKAFRLGHRIYIHTNNENESQSLDDLLWSFRADSFIPHSQGTQAEERPGQQTQIEIGHSEQPGDHHDLLINLSNHIPQFFSRFERVSEVVIQDQEVLEATRKSWAFYKARNYPLQKHDLRSKRTSR